MNILDIKKNIAKRILGSGIINGEEEQNYMINTINKVDMPHIINTYKDVNSIIFTLTKIITEKIKEKFNKKYYTDITYKESLHDFMNLSLSSDLAEDMEVNMKDNVANMKDVENFVSTDTNNIKFQLDDSITAVSKVLNNGFYRQKFSTEYINADTYGMVFGDIVSDKLQFTLVTQHITQGDILIKKPLSNIIRLRIMPFRIPHYTLFAPSYNRSPITITTDDFFVGDYLHVKTPATRTIGIEIEEIVDKIKSGINVDTGTTTVFNNPTYSNIPNGYKIIKNCILADCEYENSTYDGVFNCMTTKVTPRNDGYIELKSSIDKLDTLTISLNDTISTLYLPSPAITCTKFTALGVSQILITTSPNGTSLLPVGVQYRANITDFRLDVNNIDVSLLSTITLSEFVKDYLVQYLNTKGIPITVMRNGSSTNQLIANIVPPPYYTGDIFSLTPFKISIISRRVLIPIQVDQLRDEITTAVDSF
jgi:hypothetical protein